jgi:dTDP-L-rhamnose 4-epimerase
MGVAEPENCLKVAIITGGLGFIGSHLITEIINRYDLIIVVDSLSPAVHTDTPRIDNLDISLVVGGVQNPETWERVEKILPTEPYILTVFHLAADTSTANSLLNPSAHVSTNVLGTATLCEFLNSKIQYINRIVLTSTRAVYGEGLWVRSNGEVVNPEPRTQSDLNAHRWTPRYSNEFCVSPHPTSSQVQKPSPVNIYGETKMSQENILQIWCKAYEIELRIFRLQNVYGPGQSLWNSYSGVISLFVRKSLLGQTIEVYEGGGIIRDLVYVKDVVKILGNEFDTSKEISVVDVGSGLPVTLLEVATRIAQMCGSPSPSISDNFRIGDVRGVFADNSLIHKYNYISAFTSLENGISALVDWARIEIDTERRI